MNKTQIIKRILAERYAQPPLNSVGKAFASSNIALCKYWGKRNAELNLPMTSSLSISLGKKGCACTLRLSSASQDSFSLNGQSMSADSIFSQRLTAYLDFFRIPQTSFAVQMEMNLPLAAGLASSACGYASLVLALDQLFAWQLNSQELSILARLGSGSACRSVLPGFVEWHAGVQADGMDSYAEVFAETWPGLAIGLVILSTKQKALSSRQAMQQTIATSKLYPSWPQQVAADLPRIKQALLQRNFTLLGETAESNALSMHALMLSAWPPISYALPETISAMQSIWQLRKEGVEVYFTQDAGPNLKLLFMEENKEKLAAAFPALEIIS